MKLVIPAVLTTCKQTDFISHAALARDKVGGNKMRVVVQLKLVVKIYST